MSEWKKVKIGDFLKRKRIPVQLEADKEYKLITIKLYHKGVFLRCNKIGSEIHSNMYKVSKGDFILSGIDARNGAFGIVPDSLDGAIVTNDFWYFDIDESIIKKEFFLWLTSTPVFLDACQKSSMGETQRIRLQKDAFFNYQINCPSIEYQDEFLARINPIIEKIKTIQSETESQTEYAKLLRQNILQEAIEGKLTADWRKQNPVQKGNPDYDAEALFDQIQKEKISYTAELHLKSMNFPKINDAEVSFDSKNNWVYARGDDCFNIRSASRIHQSDWKTSGIPFLRGRELVQLAKYGKVINPETYISEEFYNELKQKSGIPSKNDLLVSAVGTLGKVYIVQETDKFYYKDAYILCFENYHKLNAKFFSLVISSPYYQKEIYKESKGTTVAQFTIGRAKFIPFPLPPLKEQEEIVNKVETLLAKVIELENQIQERKAFSEKLAFGIIKENLEG